jgi:putative tricarboxylic transport membrane protein
VKKYPLYVTLVWIGLGFFVSIYAYKLGLGQLSVPGAGFMPFWLGIIIACLALYKLITDVRIHTENAGTDERNVSAVKPRYSGIGKLAFIAIILFAYALLLEPLGYVVTTFFSMVLLLRFAGYTRWISIIIYAAIIVGVSYFLFHYLGVMFPAGIFRNLGLG